MDGSFKANYFGRLLFFTLLTLGVACSAGQGSFGSEDEQNQIIERINAGTDGDQKAFVEYFDLISTMGPIDSEADFRQLAKTYSAARFPKECDLYSLIFHREREPYLVPGQRMAPSCYLECLAKELPRSLTDAAQIDEDLNALQSLGLKDLTYSNGLSMEKLVALIKLENLGAKTQLNKDPEIQKELRKKIRSFSSDILNKMEDGKINEDKFGASVWLHAETLLLRVHLIDNDAEMVLDLLELVKKSGGHSQDFHGGAHNNYTVLALRSYPCWAPGAPPFYRELAKIPVAVEEGGTTIYLGLARRSKTTADRDRYLKLAGQCFEKNEDSDVEGGFGGLLVDALAKGGEIPDNILDELGFPSKEGIEK